MTYYIVAPPEIVIVNVLILIISGMGFYCVYNFFRDQDFIPYFWLCLAFIAFMVDWIVINGAYHLVEIVLP